MLRRPQASHFAFCAQSRCFHTCTQHTHTASFGPGKWSKTRPTLLVPGVPALRFPVDLGVTKRIDVSRATRLTIASGLVNCIRVRIESIDPFGFFPPLIQGNGKSQRVHKVNSSPKDEVIVNYDVPLQRMLAVQQFSSR